MFGFNLNEAFQQAADFVSDTADAVGDAVQDVVGEHVEELTGQVGQACLLPSLCIGLTNLRYFGFH